MSALQVALHALRTEHALVERKVVPRLEADDEVVFDFEIDAALLPAKAAVRRNDLVRLRTGVDAQPLHPIEVRPPRVDQYVLVSRKRCHGIPQWRTGNPACPLSPCPDSTGRIA